MKKILLALALMLGGCAGLVNSVLPNAPAPLAQNHN
jgi:uncharacterized protein YceK